MKINIDETELARLEKLALRATAVPYHYFENSLRDGHGNQIAEITQDHDDFAHDIHDTAYIAAACNAVPALVAEVRRLREKVEAWEWFEECFEAMQWLVPMGPNRGNACEEAVISTLHAQKSAVNVDRE